MKLGYNELGYNELGYNELGYNELGYKQTLVDKKQIIFQRFISFWLVYNITIFYDFI